MSFAIILIELMALVANFCMPVWQNARRGAEADAVVRQMMQVKAAAEQEHAQRGVWAASGDPGVSPTELGMFLPPGFVFQQPHYSFVWQRWALAAPSENDGGLTADVVGESSSPEFAGVTVVTRDPRLAAMVARRIPAGVVRFTLGNRTTLVINAPGAPATN